MTLTKEELSGLIDWWGTIEDISTGVVLIGVAGEFIAELTTLIKKERRKRITIVISTLLVIVGIAGELTTQHRLASFNDQLVAIVEAEADAAKTQASAAIAEAARLGVTVQNLPNFVTQKEKDISAQLNDFQTFLNGERIRDDALLVELNKDKEELEAARNDAVSAVDSTKKSLDNIKGELSKDKDMRDKIAAALTPRNLTAEQQRSIYAKISKVSDIDRPSAIVVFSSTGAFESARLADQIAASLTPDLSGKDIFRASEIAGSYSLFSLAGVGVITNGDESAVATADALVKALTDEGVLAFLLPEQKQHNCDGRMPPEEIKKNKFCRTIVVEVGDHP